jgi:hypothetical protein
MQETNLQDLKSDADEGRRVLIRRVLKLMEKNRGKEEIFKGLARGIEELDKRNYSRAYEIFSSVKEYDLEYMDKKELAQILEFVEKMRKNRKERDLKKAW